MIEARNLPATSPVDTNQIVVTEQMGGVKELGRKMEPQLEQQT